MICRSGSAKVSRGQPSVAAINGKMGGVVPAGSSICAVPSWEGIVNVKYSGVRTHQQPWYWLCRINSSLSWFLEALKHQRNWNLEIRWKNAKSLFPWNISYMHVCIPLFRVYDNIFSVGKRLWFWQTDLTPVPLSIFRSNSKFDENSKHCSVTYKWPITTIFCTRHDSVTVVTCAKYLCDRSGIFKTRAFWIFIEFRIRSKYA